jgi:hypothetical protein
MRPKPQQHKITVEVDGEKYEGHYTLESVGRWERLIVWFQGNWAGDPTIAPEAEDESKEWIARGLLRDLVKQRLCS